MRRLRLSASSLFFRLSVAASAFALGLALCGLRPRQDAPRTPPVVAVAQPAAPARAEVSIGDTPADEDEAGAAIFEGVYQNFVYGYAVEIPSGMLGLNSPPPMPQHGFGIDLDNPRSTTLFDPDNFPKSYIDVDGSYNSLEWRRLDDAVKSQLSFLREKGKNVRVRSRTRTRLGPLRAVRVVVRFELDGEEMVNDQVVAFNDDGEGEPSPVYTLDLTTPLAKYERDRPVLEALQKSWCLQPVE